MNLFLILAQAPTFVDAGAGQLFPSLLGSLGTAGAAIAVTRWYVGFLRTKAERERRIIEDFKGCHSDLQREFQDQLDRLFDCHQQSQQAFQTYVALISDTQNTIVRDMIVMINNNEKIIDGSTEKILGIQTSIGALRPTGSAIDSQACHMADRSRKSHVDQE